MHLTRLKTSSTVIAGPFAGMKYIGASQGSAYIPKLLGIYERELVSVVEELCQLKPGLIIDIGAAEGYYAVGLALRCPSARVVAYEMEPIGQERLAEMCKLNDSSTRLEIRGKCDAAELKSILKDSVHTTIIVCDVEGFEEELLKPQCVPALCHAHILVELHDFIIPGITETLIDRFRESHSIEHIWQQPRSIEDFPWRTFGTALLPRRYLDWAVSEWRPVKMAWLYLKPRKNEKGSDENHGAGRTLGA